MGWYNMNVYLPYPPNVHNIKFCGNMTSGSERVNLSRNPWFAVLVPAIFGISIPENPKMQILVLSSGCAQFEQNMLHIRSTNLGVLGWWIFVQIMRWIGLGVSELQSERRTPDGGRRAQHDAISPMAQGLKMGQETPKSFGYISNRNQSTLMSLSIMIKCRKHHSQLP